MPQPLNRLRLRSSAGSLAQTLGAYYLDLTPVLPIVEAGYHGPFDAQGVPLNRTRGEPVYSPITIAQYALALHDAALAADGSQRSRYWAGFEAQLAALEGLCAQDDAWRGFFRHAWPNEKYPDLPVPWVSALSQGNVLSALLRAHQQLGSGRWMALADLVFRALERPQAEGGVRFEDACGHLWFEEYPTTPPVLVLNGFIFALWGVLDYARATGSAQAWDWWRRGVSTLLVHLPEFDCGYWSVYDLRYRELASFHYQVNIHVPQMEAMHALTGEPVFGRYAERWRRFAGSWWHRARWWAGLRIHARRRRPSSRGGR